MKKFTLAAAVALVLFVFCLIVFGDEKPAAFDLDKAEVTGLVYGAGSKSSPVGGAAAIVSQNNVSTFVRANSVYLLDGGVITAKVSGKRALDRLPDSARLDVSDINSAGVTMTHMGRTLTVPLKRR